MSLARKILGNTFWQVLGRITTAAIAMLTVRFLTQYWGGDNIAVGQAKYGDYVTIYDFLTFFGALADLGIFTIAVREMSKREDRQQEIFSSTLSLRFVSLVVALLVGIGVAFLIPQYQGTEIPKGIAIAALGIGFFILSGTFASILLVRLQMKFHAIALVVGKIVTFGAILATMFLFDPEPTEESFYAIIWAGVWGSIVTLMITTYGARKYVSLMPRWDGAVVRSIFLMALPFGIATFLNTVYLKMDILMMSTLLPRSGEGGECLALLCGDQQNGIYGVAVRIMDVLIILPLYFMNSVLPSLTQSIQEKEQEKTRRRLSLSALFLLMIALPAVVGLFTLATPVAELLTPPDFGSDVALRILAFPLLFTFFTTFLTFVLIAFGEQKKILWINFGAVLLNFFLNIWAIPRYGYVGAAVTSLISEGFILCWGAYFVAKIVRFPLELKKIGGIVVSTAVMGVVTFVGWRYGAAELGAFALAVIVPLSGLVYGGGLLLTGAVEMGMIRGGLRGAWKK